MSTLVAIAYPKEDTAEQAVKELRELQSEYLVDVQSAVWATKDAQGKVQVHGVETLAGPQAAWGGFWGLLLGLIFFVPVGGLLLGAGLGALFGHFTKIGIDKDFVKQLSDEMGPNSSAIFILASSSAPDKVVSEMSKFGGKVIQTNLSAADDERLQEALNVAQSSGGN